MITIPIRPFAALASLWAAPLLSVAAEEKAPPPPPKTERREMRIIRSHDPQGAPKEKVAFLGVQTAPVSPTLAAQLGLPADTGLVVMSVVPDSPAGPVLKEHDILTKLDDQILIDTRQLAVLVRRHQAGDEVGLTLVRGGKEQTVRVKLSQREMPRLPSPGQEQGMMFPGRRLDLMRDRLPGGDRLGAIGPARPFAREEAGRMLGLLHDGPGAAVGIYEGREGGPTRRVFMHPGRSKMVFKDDAGTLEISFDNGRKHLLARDANDREVFNGPVGTPAERQALPEAVRTRLEKLEKLEGVNFDRLDRLNTGEGGGERKVDQLFRLPVPAPGASRGRPPAI